MFCYFVIAFLILISSSHFSSFNVQLILSLLISVFFFICQFTVHLLYKFCTDLYKSWMFSRVSIVNRTKMRTLSISMFCFVFYKVSVMIELLWITQVTSFVCFCCSLSSFWLCFLFLFFYLSSWVVKGSTRKSDIFVGSAHLCPPRQDIAVIAIHGPGRLLYSSSNASQYR